MVTGNVNWPTGIGRVAHDSSRRPRSLTLIAALLLILGAGALRFYHIGAQSLWLDEGFTVAYSDTKSFGATMHLILDSQGSERFSPLYLFLLHGVIRLWGDSEFALRSSSGICGIAAVGVLMAAAAAFFDRRAALLAGVLAASSAFAVWYSQDARPYSLLLLLVSLQLWALGRYLSRARAEPTHAGRLQIAVVSGVGLFGNILFAISSVSLCLAHLITASDRRRWWAAWWPAAVASMPAMAFYFVSAVTRSLKVAGLVYLQQNPLMNLGYTIFGELVGITYGPPQVALRGADKLSVAAAYLPDLACAGLLGLALLATIVLAWRLRRPEDPRWSNHALLGIAIFCAAGCAVALVVATRTNWLPRHAFFAFPPALLVLSFSLSELSRTTSRVLRGHVVLALVAFLGTNAWSLYNYYTLPQYGKDDYRGAAAYLNQHREPGVPSVLIGGMIVVLRYYGDGETIDLSGVPDSGLVPRLLKLSQPTGEVVVAINRRFYVWGGADPEVVFATAFDVREHKVLQYFDIYRLAVRKKNVVGRRPLSFPSPRDEVADHDTVRSPGPGRVRQYDTRSRTFPRSCVLRSARSD